MTQYYMEMEDYGVEPDPDFVDSQLREFGGDGRVTYDEFAIIMLRLAASDAA
eukprot:gene13383-66728_t